MTINFNDVTDTATPTSGTFNTGGNANIRGSGQNLVTQSQTFSSAWGNTAVTINQTATTAPNGTATGNSITPTAASSIHRINSIGLNNINGVTYTASVYAKANGYNFLFINCGTAFTAGTTFNLSTGAISATTAGTATITNVGDGWYRCTVTGTATSSNAGTVFLQVNSTQAGATDEVFTGNGTSGIFLWGAQLEIGPTANTYVLTTTATIYGTPTLSLSEVAGLGLQSDGSLYVRPAGTGALQAQPTTSSTVGGNARGPNAVDWQKSRVAATQVASSSFSFIGSGDSNTAAAFGSVIVGGSTNSTTGGAYNCILGGVSNVTGSNGQVITMGGGHANSAQGFFNFIGCGYANSGTAGPAVTTQSATMNGTTAVTLSGSNAAIKVGQLVSGTSIGSYPHTYVAAISGTSLTLSQNATGSTTNTLSFFTPHGIVVGGGNNQATGAYSFIGGGGDAGTAANRNVASGDWSFVGGGRNNTASGNGSVVCGGGVYAVLSPSTFPNLATGNANFVGAGINNTASGDIAAIVGGQGNVSSGSRSFVGAGIANTASGGSAAIMGGNYGVTRGIEGNHVFPACNVPIASFQGVSQAALLVLGVQTTDATATVLRCNTSAAGTTNQVILPNNSAYFFKGSVIANVTGAANGAAWSFEGAIMRGANAASTVLIDTPSVNRVAASAGATTWTIALTADTTNGGLAVTVTGVAATTIRWVAKVETTEVTF